MDDVVESVKSANRIEDVIAETYPLRGRGRYLRAAAHDSLVVDVYNQAYHWNSASEHGDVISWVMVRQGVDFKTAVEWLCRRAKIPEPNWRHETAAARLVGRMREDALTVGTMVFSRWLWQCEEALAYARSRGWSDETIRAAMLGYCGEGKPEERKELIDELQLHGIEIDSPGAVALIGFAGDVEKWCRKHGLDVDVDWMKANRIPGVFGRRMLIYPHVFGGRVKYLSGRGIREKQHWNLPASLTGGRQVYVNWEYSSRAEHVVIVEGQADAITLGQWGIGSIALAGTTATERLAKLVDCCGATYVGLDADEAGMDAAWKIAATLGPMIRLVKWAATEEVKDANDLLRVWTATGIPNEEQGKQVMEMLEGAQTIVEVMATAAGNERGAKKDAAERQAFELIARMDEVMLAQYRDRLAAAMGMKKGDFDSVLKALVKEKTNGKKVAVETVETLGGAIGFTKDKAGWLLEYMYDRETDMARLAYRDPDGKVGVAGDDGILIDGIRYIPKRVNSFVRDGAVLFPSALGELKPTRELVGLIEFFIHRHYLLDNKLLGRIIAYYVLLTWIYDAFNAIPYLRAMGEPGAGKSELMRRVGHICYRMITASGANSAATFFRTTEIYRGTVFIDEADLHDGGDMANDLVKYLNLGAMKGNPISRLVESFDAEGRKIFEPGTFTTFGPKLIAMRKDFKDAAVGSRAITIPLMEKDPMELKAVGVKLYIDNEFRMQAQHLRNLLLRWRLEHWRPEIEVGEDLMDMDINARLNQVTMPLKALARRDEELMKEIERFLRAYYADIVLDRSMTLAARIVEAMWEIWRDADLRAKHVHAAQNGGYYIFVGDITAVANRIIDDMNAVGQEDDDEEDEDRKAKRKRDALTSRGVGALIRKTLHLEVGQRQGTGYPVYWDDLKMRALGKQYGVLSAEEAEGR